MQPMIMTACVLANNDAPLDDGAECGIITTREEKLAEAFSLIASMDERQLSIFIALLGKELL